MADTKEIKNKMELRKLLGTNSSKLISSLLLMSQPEPSRNFSSIKQFREKISSESQRKKPLLICALSIKDAAPALISIPSCSLLKTVILAPNMDTATRQNSIRIFESQIGSLLRQNSDALLLLLEL